MRIRKQSVFLSAHTQNKIFGGKRIEDVRSIIHFISYDKNTERSTVFLEFHYLRKIDRFRPPFHAFLGHKHSQLFCYCSRKSLAGYFEFGDLAESGT